MKLRAAPETERHTLQLSEPPPTAMAVSLRVTNSHGHKPPCALARAMHCKCITHQKSNLSCLDGGIMAVRVRTT